MDRSSTYLTLVLNPNHPMYPQKQIKMKKLLLFTVIIFCGMTIFIAGCSKDIVGRTDNTPALTPASLDENAGTWKPILLTAPGEFPLAAPGAVTTPDYIAQVNEIKALQAELTNDEKALVKFWSAGAVLRWNEILRELVAKHNLPPYQNEDGTYPLPSANNPLAYPQFPFSNPP